jgi:hypothetical protein
MSITSPFLEAEQEKSERRECELFGTKVCRYLQVGFLLARSRSMSVPETYWTFNERMSKAS